LLQAACSYLLLLVSRPQRTRRIMDMSLGGGKPSLAENGAISGAFRTCENCC
jgi:hypothetical protein